MVYYSKIDLWLVIVLFLGLSPAIVPLFWDFSWVAFAINVVLVVFLVGMFRNTKYVIEDEKLIVKTGFLFSESCDVHQILSVKRTRTCLSAPALSLDRLRIDVTGGGLFVISPRRKKEFVEHLLKINPEIIVEA